MTLCRPVARNAGELDPLIAELKAAAAGGAPPGPKALAIQNELRRLHVLKHSLAELESACATRHTALGSLDLEHNRHRYHQFRCPENVDPDIWGRYLSLLDGSIDTAARQLREFDVHLYPLEQKLRPHNP